MLQWKDLWPNVLLIFLNGLQLCCAFLVWLPSAQAPSGFSFAMKVYQQRVNCSHLKANLANLANTVACLQSINYPLTNFLLPHWLYFSSVTVFPDWTIHLVTLYLLYERTQGINFLSLFPGSLSHCDTTTSSTTTSSTVPRGAVAELKMPRGSHGRLLQHHLSQPTTKPTQPLVTQMQPPMLPPPPHPNFQSVHFHAHSQTLGVTSKALDTTVPVLTEHLSHLTLTSSRTQFERQGSDVLLMKPDSKGSKIHAVTLASQITEFVTETSVPQPTNPPVGMSFSSLMLDSYLPTTNQSPETNNSGSSTVPSASQEDPTQLHQLVTENEFHQSYHQPTLTQISQTKLEDLGRPLQQRTHSPTLSQIPPPVDQQSFTQKLFPKFHLELPTTQHYLASTQPSPTSATKPQQFNSQPLPALSQPTSTISTLPQNRPRPSPTQHPLVHAQSPPPQTEAFPVQRREPSIPTLHPPDQTSHPSTSAPEIHFVHLVNTSDQVQLNNSQQGDTVQSVKTPNDTELTEWLKRNTSQSPMTSNDPR